MGLKNGFQKIKLHDVMVCVALIAIARINILLPKSPLRLA